MFFFFYEHPELLEKSSSDEDVNILVGINGSGKSTYLNELARHHIGRGKTVIAIANTIYDKFDFKGKKAKVLRSSVGKNIAKHSIKQVLKILERGDSKAYFNLFNVFNYINLIPRIEFKIYDLNPEFRDIIINSEYFTLEEREDLLYFLNRSHDYYLGENENIFILSFANKDFDSTRNIFFLKILHLESKLKKIKVLKSIGITLFKENEDFPLDKASSGELTLIASLIFLSVNIDDNTVILIDEPENSLHPKWQIEYVKKITELFYFYQPKIVIATHSPLIINGAELNLKNINIFKGKSFAEFYKQDKDLKNVEEIYEGYFDLSTPENRFLSQHIINKFNLLSERKLTYWDFENIINELIKNSFDEKQKDAFKGILELANKYS
jgi:predicted ATPase